MDSEGKEPEKGQDKGQDEAQEDGEELTWDAYRPSHNAGPHFYLPVLRYLYPGQLEEEKREAEEHRAGGGADKATEANSSRKRKATATATDDDDVVELSRAEQLHEREELAREEDFTTDHREDVPSFNPASALPPPPPPSSGETKSDSTDPSAPPSSPELVLTAMRWGLIPSWTTAPDLPSADASQAYTMINARAESVDQARTYKTLIHRRRCVTVVDAYFEWHVETVRGNPRKQPYAFRPNYVTPPLTADSSTLTLLDKYERESDDKPFFLLASLYDAWWDASRGEVLYSLTVLTTSAGQKVGWAHERQPVILSHSDALKWLQWWKYGWEECRPFVVTPWSDGVEWYRVPDCVSNVRNQTSDCTMALEEFVAKSKANGIGRFFGSTAKTETKGEGKGEDHAQQQTKGKVSEDSGWAPSTPEKKKAKLDVGFSPMPIKSPASDGKKMGSGGWGSGGGVPSAATKREQEKKAQMSLTSFFLHK